MASEEQGRAQDRLRDAVAEQDASKDGLAEQEGTPRQLDAQVRAAVADEQVAAREAWLSWVDRNE